jgi:hypothetical protein
VARAAVGARARAGVGARFHEARGGKGDAGEESDDDGETHVEIEGLGLGGLDG